MNDVRSRTEAQGPADSGKRRQILDGARQIFLAQGFDGASMGSIAKAAGVSKGTLYVYFKDKEALFEALTQSEKSGLAEVLFRLDESDPDVPSALRLVGRTLLDMMVRPDHISSVRMVIGAADKFPAFARSFYEAGPKLGAARLKSYLDGQVSAGRLEIADTALAAEQFLNLCSAGILKRLLFGIPESCAPESLDHNVEGAIEVFLAAYARSSSRKAAATRD
ncbi:TetR/AcrR family transcriptional regulator [Enterovirga rhinocerotis]|uniref:TetR family transcriptional regulator n=1 Tax=Enterovirga rhinocerotis TaxID=1339210 RepID=A0A4R7BXV9_9HYPH|nr:TetR/AcrR family transcriptional regulator [Enterovirga rhinocerotis]TDR89037.1 TetR family transcriptional regulator [Enterovirga rhinocerotis]